MTNSFKSIALGLAVASAPLLSAAPATAQSMGVGSVNLEAAVGNAAALKAAEAQVQTQYKPQFDAFNARRAAIGAQLDPMIREIQTLQGNAATPQAALQAKVTAYRAREAAAQRELQPLAVPFQRPLAYAQEQVTAQLDSAVKAAMTAKNIGIIVKPEAVLAIQPSVDLTTDVTNQLNTLVKTVSITPPPGWQPGQNGGQGAPAAAAAPAAAGARPAPRPQGR